MTGPIGKSGSSPNSGAEPIRAELEKEEKWPTFKAKVWVDGQLMEQTYQVVPLKGGKNMSFEEARRAFPGLARYAETVGQLMNIYQLPTLMTEGSVGPEAWGPMGLGAMIDAARGKQLEQPKFPSSITLSGSKIYIDYPSQSGKKRREIELPKHDQENLKKAEDRAKRDSSGDPVEIKGPVGKQLGQEELEAAAEARQAKIDQIDDILEEAEAAQKASIPGFKTTARVGDVGQLWLKSDFYRAHQSLKSHDAPSHMQPRTR